MQSSRRWWVTGILGFLWLFMITGAYYVTHKPITAEGGLALLLAAWRVVAALALTALGGGLGRRLLRLDGLPALTRAALEACFGLGVLAPGLLLIGATLGAPRWLFWLALPALMGLLRRHVVDWLHAWRALGDLWRESDGFGKGIAAMLGLAAASTLTIALSPPVKFDALMYHLTLPQAYLDSGRVDYLPWIIMSGMPQTVEMLHTWMMALAGGEGATVLGWAAAHLGVLGLVGYLQGRLGTRAAWVGGAALLGGYTLAASTAWGYADWWGLLFGFGMLVCLERWQADGVRSWLVRAGLFAGMALASKYTAGVAVLTGIVVVLWQSRRSIGGMVRSGLTFGGAVLAVMAPWLLKNLLTTGNPFYPLLFEAGAMTAIRQAVYQGLPPWGNWQDVLLLPWRATYLGVDGYEGYSVSIGPLLLGLGALFWINWRGLEEANRRLAQTGGMLALAGLLVWALGNQVSGFLIQTRFYYPVFSAFAVLAAVGFHRLDQYRTAPVRLARLAGALVWLVLGLNLIEIGSEALARKAPQAALGLESRQAYLTANLGWYFPATQAVKALAEESRVLMLYEPRSYYCRPNCFPDEILDRWRRDRIQHGSAGNVIEAWRAEGFTHVLINRTGAAFLRESGDLHSTTEDWQALDDLFALVGEGVELGGDYSLHRLDE